MKNQIKLHKFTAPTADTILAGAGISNTDTAANSDTGGKEGGETLKIPELFTTKIFVDVINNYWIISSGETPDKPEYSLDDVSEQTYCEYMQYLRLIDVLNFIDDEEQRVTILTAIQNQGWNLVERIADEFPILQPFLKDYTESEADK